MTIRNVLVILTLIVILLFVQYRLWFQPGGIVEMREVKKKLKTQMIENAKLKESNDELLSQIKQLQSSQDALESRARYELGMIKKDETFYQIVKRT